MGNYNNFKKHINKMDGVASAAESPKFWIDFGNYVINKTMSGRYTHGIPQGRLTKIAGPSGAGKSYMAGNLIKSAQKQGYGILVIDSENALDDPFMEGIGVNTDDPDYLYAGVSVIDDCISIVQAFLADFGVNEKKDENTKPFLIVIDSLDMLLTATENKNYKKGIIKGDQGQQAKQIKRMLTGFVQDVKQHNVAMVCTKQVYQEQDPIAAMSNPWVITPSLRFAFSQIMLVTPLQLKDKTTKQHEGFNLRVFGEKTRFTKPFQKCTIEVPYETGLSPYSGVLEACESYGIVEKNGSWYTLGENKFQSGKAEQYNEEMLELLLEREAEILNVETGEEDLSDVGSEEETVKRRLTRKGKKSKK